MKIWAKTFDNNEYRSHNIAHAVYGFHELGAEIVKYKRTHEIYDFVSREDIVLDFIDQCKMIFAKFGVTPNIPDYPANFSQFLHRKIWTDTIDSISSNEEKWSAGNFVKPIKEKAFTGRIVSSIGDLVGCGNHAENYKVYVSTPIDIRAEWRCFILYDKIIDVRPYSGRVLSGNNDSWKYNYDYKVVEEMMKCFNEWDNRPAACSMDIAVIQNNKSEGTSENDNTTALIEFNDAYALGNYGLDCIAYARLISARWSQLLNRPDEFCFNH